MRPDQTLDLTDSIGKKWWKKTAEIAIFRTSIYVFTGGWPPGIVVVTFFLFELLACNGVQVLFICSKSVMSLIVSIESDAV